MEKYIDFSKKLGKGNFSSVKLVQRKSDNKLFAMKMIDINTNAVENVGTTNNETMILEKLHHPNIVEFYEAFVYEEHLCLIMEYCDQGDLQQKIKETKKKGEYFSEELILEWFIQLCLAVKYLHDSRIIHRDIKVHNTFLNSEGIIKLGDFGISKQLERTGDLATTQIGTPFYLTPEMCSHSTSSHKSDLWMLGCILHELCSLEKPFSGDNIPNVIHKIMQEKYAPIPEHYSPLIHKLVHILLEKDHHKRPSIEDILLIPEVIEEVKKLKLRHSNIYPSSLFLQKKSIEEPSTNISRKTIKIENDMNSEKAKENQRKFVIENEENMGINKEMKLESSTQKGSTSLKNLDEEGKIDNGRNLEISSRLSPISSRQSPTMSTKRKANNIRALIEQKRANVPASNNFDKNQNNANFNNEANKAEDKKTESVIQTQFAGANTENTKQTKNESMVKGTKHSSMAHESSRKNQKLSINIPEIPDNTNPQMDSKGKPSSIRSATSNSSQISSFSQSNRLQPKKKSSFSDQVFDPLSPGSPNRPFFTIQFLKMQIGDEKYEKLWELIEKHEDPKRLMNEDSNLIIEIIGEENAHLRKMIEYLIFKRNDMNSGQTGRIIFTPSQAFKSPASATSLFKNSFLIDSSIDAGKDDHISMRKNHWNLTKQKVKADVSQNILEDEVVGINENIKP